MRNSKLVIREKLSSPKPNDPNPPVVVLDFPHWLFELFSDFDLRTLEYHLGGPSCWRVSSSTDRYWRGSFPSSSSCSGSSRWVSCRSPNTRRSRHQTSR